MLAPLPNVTIVHVASSLVEQKAKAIIRGAFPFAVMHSTSTEIPSLSPTNNMIQATRNAMTAKLRNQWR